MEQRVGCIAANERPCCISPQSVIQVLDAKGSHGHQLTAVEHGKDVKGLFTGVVHCEVATAVCCTFVVTL